MTRRPASFAACAASVALLAACSSRVCEPTNGASCGTEPSDLAPTAHHTGTPQPANGKASIAKPASSAEPLVTAFSPVSLAAAALSPPKPPRITLMKERFIPLHMM